ncbi:DUF4880 domain-containing protein [Pseudomonas sp. MAFF 302046]|uniref:DUF4880 domain-containing protein n=1 Tax=Pseudomonas morbosilactucae TaxID=2938197 RepID=A0ABT0JGS2_9PSED|nr:DUF4880 domain-containing protein [Pseudomonas morbosilactucae]MCK9815037.1 DUF4880 domain-containing protein [Pseudomonas morbosilactucae]
MTEHLTALPGDAAREQASDWFTQREAMTHNVLLRQRFEQWRSADPQHAEAFRALENLWNASAFEQALEHLALDLELPAASAPARRQRRPQRWLAAAAALLVMLGAGWIGDLPMRLQADHLSAIGQVERFDLATAPMLSWAATAPSAATSVPITDVSACCGANSMSRPSTISPGR